MRRLSFGWYCLCHLADRLSFVSLFLHTRCLNHLSIFSFFASAMSFFRRTSLLQLFLSWFWVVFLNSYPISACFLWSFSFLHESDFTALRTQVGAWSPGLSLAYALWMDTGHSLASFFCETMHVSKLQRKVFILLFRVWIQVRYAFPRLAKGFSRTVLFHFENIQPEESAIDAPVSDPILSESSSGGGPLQSLRKGCEDVGWPSRLMPF